MLSRYSGSSTTIDGSCHFWYDLTIEPSNPKLEKSTFHVSKIDGLQGQLTVYQLLMFRAIVTTDHQWRVQFDLTASVSGLVQDRDDSRMALIWNASQLEENTLFPKSDCMNIVIDGDQRASILSMGALTPTPIVYVPTLEEALIWCGSHQYDTVYLLLPPMMDSTEENILSLVRHPQCQSIDVIMTPVIATGCQLHPEKWSDWYELDGVIKPTNKQETGYSFYKRINYAFH